MVSKFHTNTMPARRGHCSTTGLTGSKRLRRFAPSDVPAASSCRPSGSAHGIERSGRACALGRTAGEHLPPRVQRRHGEGVYGELVQKGGGSHVPQTHRCAMQSRGAQPQRGMPSSEPRADAPWSSPPDTNAPTRQSTAVTSPLCACARACVRCGCLSGSPPPAPTHRNELVHRVPHLPGQILRTSTAVTRAHAYRKGANGPHLMQCPQPQRAGRVARDEPVTLEVRGEGADLAAVMSRLHAAGVCGAPRLHVDAPLELRLERECSLQYGVGAVEQHQHAAGARRVQFELRPGTPHRLPLPSASRRTRKACHGRRHACSPGLWRGRAARSSSSRPCAGSSGPSDPWRRSA
jgi:hypothetical protein